MEVSLREVGGFAAKEANDDAQASDDDGWWPDPPTLMG